MLLQSVESGKSKAALDLVRGKLEVSKRGNVWATAEEEGLGGNPHPTRQCLLYKKVALAFLTSSQEGWWHPHLLLNPDLRNKLRLAAGCGQRYCFNLLLPKKGKVRILRL